ncbi:MAG: hypothetical protein ABL885_10215 [Methylophilaceae bacterium]
MTHKDESVTLDWLNTTQEILSKADNLLSPQTINLLMSLANMKEVDDSYLTDLSISEVVALVSMAQAAVRHKRELAIVVPFRPKATISSGKQFHRADEEIEPQTEATIMPFRTKANRYNFSRLQ